MMLEIPQGNKLQGFIDWQVLDVDGSIIQESSQRNLITNYGMNRMALDLNITTWRTYLVVGSGTTDVKTSSGAITASQTGTVVTASSAIFAATMVGNTIKFASGQQAFITAFTSTTVVTVRESQTVASALFTIYHTNRSTLATEIVSSRTNSNGGFGAEETTTYVNDSTNKQIVCTSRVVRVFTAASNLTINEFGLSNSNTSASATLTVIELPRDGGGNPISLSLTTGQQLKVTHDFIIKAGPYDSAGQSVSVPFSGYSGVTSLDGKYSLYSRQSDEQGGMSDNIAKTIWPYATKSLFSSVYFTDAGARVDYKTCNQSYSGQIATAGSVALTADNYVTDSFTRTFRGELGTSQLNGSNVLGYGFSYYVSSSVSTTAKQYGLWFWFDTPASLAKTDTKKFLTNYTVSWMREL